LEERRVTSGTRVLSFLSGTLLGGGIGFVARDCFTETTLIGSKVVPALKYVVSNVVSPVTMTTLISVAVMGICLIGYERAFTRIFDHLGRRRSF
jgi:hypothetical protein